MAIDRENIMRTTKYQKQQTSYPLIKNSNIFDIINDRINAGHNGASVIVPHVCNNANSFGAGFAAQVARLYPDVKANFHMLGNKSKLGHTQFVISKTNSQYKHSIIFANMIAQNGLISPKNPRPLNYYALSHCMNDVKLYVKNLILNDANRVEIHCPKFGSGLAGGDWNFINYLIEDIWFDLSTFIYTINK